MNDYTVLVNSTDSFEDCWHAFFTLFAAYWPRPHPSIVLNTETKTYSHPGVDIVSSHSAALSHSARVPNWSESIGVCLDQVVETDYVLYLQEDYFLEGPVQTRLIDECIDLMRTHDLNCIRLMELGNAGPWTQSEIPLLWDVGPSSKYLVSTQASLWKRSFLRSLLRLHETPWQFEIWGSGRVRRSDHRVMCLRRDLYARDINPVIPYTPTGIVKGRWNSEVVQHLFAQHGIAVDYSARGSMTRLPRYDHIGPQCSAGRWHDCARTGDGRVSEGRRHPLSEHVCRSASRDA